MSQSAQDEILGGTSIHEAAHCVVSLFFGYVPAYVTTIPIRKSRTVGAMQPAGWLMRPDLVRAREDLWRSLAMLQLLAAGGIAESLAYPDPDHDTGDGSDRRAMHRVASAFCGGNKDETLALCQWADARVKRILSEPATWARVQRLARVLRTERHLATEDITRIVGI